MPYYRMDPVVENGIASDFAGDMAYTTIRVVYQIITESGMADTSNAISH